MSINETSRPSPKGIGGILLFFAFSSVVINPIALVYTIVEYSNLTFDTPTPSLDIAAYFKLLLIIDAVDTIFRFIVGYLVWSGDLSAKKWTIRYLYVSAALSACSLWSSYAFFPKPAAQAIISQMSSQFWKSLFWCLAWWLYFNLSERVSNNYDPSYREPIRDKPMTCFEVGFSMAGGVFLLFGLIATLTVSPGRNTSTSDATYFSPETALEQTETDSPFHPPDTLSELYSRQNNLEEEMDEANSSPPKKKIEIARLIKKAQESLLTPESPAKGNRENKNIQIGDAYLTIPLPESTVFEQKQDDFFSSLHNDDSFTYAFSCSQYSSLYSGIYRIYSLNFIPSTSEFGAFTPPLFQIFTNEMHKAVQDASASEYLINSRKDAIAKQLGIKIVNMRVENLEITDMRYTNAIAVNGKADGEDVHFLETSFYSYIDGALFHLSVIDFKSKTKEESARHLQQWMNEIKAANPLTKPPAIKASVDGMGDDPIFSVFA